MADHTPKEVEQLEQKAETEELRAQQASNSVNDALSSAGPQRQYSKDKSQNKR